MKLLKIIFLFYIILEFVSIIYVGNYLGFFPLLSEIIISAFIGILILFNLRMELADVLNNILQNKIQISAFVRGNFAKFFGGVLLIFPGVFCDIFGIILLINAYFILKQKDTTYTENENDEIIDIEIMESEESRV
ncbi:MULTISPECIES: FxsA family protein [unclassified Helicobacter]|uniref:FxsA family protein n=1 Tax=unclassified Helicobacter TaxID=2593540 RepID=UPI001315746D|nr:MULTISPECIES: FxsA family protein [unclassified Helicobacter]